jgi:hypothetical protein
VAIRTQAPAAYTPQAPDVAAGAVGSAKPDASGRLIRAAALFALAIGAYGIMARDVVVTLGLGRPLIASTNVFFRLYALHEASFLWLIALAGALTWVAAYRAPSPVTPRWPMALMARIARVPVWSLAAVVLALTAAGGALVMHGIGLSMDEFAATFQARIFASGRIEAPVPDEWRGLAPWMTPVFINYKPVAGVWVSAYLPAYAAIRAAFSLASVEWLVNPVLAAMSVVLLAAVTRRLWVGDRRVRAGGLALLFLLLSAQFLVTSMSSYSMPAHLCLNLLWLWLYLRADVYSLAALPWVGVLALGLHNPVPHALFAAPFLLRLVRDRRFGWAAYCGAIYLAGALAWYQWLAFVYTGVPAPAGSAAVGGRIASGILSAFSLAGVFEWFVQGMAAALFFAWQTPAVAILLPVGFMAWRRLGTVERDLAAGLLVTWGFYALFEANQGHGWGYRYLYPVLGSAVLLAARGADDVWRAGRETLVSRLVVASAAITLAAQLPLRVVQTEKFVRPYAAALEYIESRSAPVVAFDPHAAWYGRDLVRNDPLFVSTPKVLGVIPPGGWGPNARFLPPAARGRIEVLTADDLARFGLPVFQQTRR